MPFLTLGEKMDTNSQNSSRCHEGNDMQKCYEHRRRKKSKSITQKDAKNPTPQDFIAQIIKRNMSAKSKTPFCNIPDKYGYDLCPNYIPDISSRGFKSNLDDLRGTKIRRHSILCFMIWMSIVFAFLSIVTIGRPDWQDRGGMIPLYIFLIIVLLLAYGFSLLNRHWFGKVVAVVTKSSLYINTKRIKWNEITDVTFQVELPTKWIPVTYSCIQIRCNDGKSYTVYHASYQLYKTIKKHARNARLCIRSLRRELLTHGILLIVVMVVLVVGITISR